MSQDHVLFSPFHILNLEISGLVFKLGKSFPNQNTNQMPTADKQRKILIRLEQINSVTVLVPREIILCLIPVTIEKRNLILTNQLNSNFSKRLNFNIIAV